MIRRNFLTALGLAPFVALPARRADPASPKYPVGAFGDVGPPQTPRVIVNKPGSGFTRTPGITISRTLRVVVNNGGSGYTTAPIVTISRVPGSFRT